MAERLGAKDLITACVDQRAAMQEAEITALRARVAELEGAPSQAESALDCALKMAGDGALRGDNLDRWVTWVGCFVLPALRRARESAPLRPDAALTPDEVGG